MFAHQVIESIKKYPQAVISLTLQNALIASIRKAQHFHFGSSLEIGEAFKNMWGKGIPSENLYLLKLPYNRCWFDYCGQYPDGTTLKRGFLLEQDDASKIIIYTFLTDSDFWRIDFLAHRLGAPAADGVWLENMGLYEAPGADAACRSRNTRNNLSVLYFSMMLLNCKNIGRETVSAPAKLNKKRRRNGNQELFDYYVLNIAIPSKKQEYREGAIPLSHNRVHFCRGHFKEYTAEHPLFGRYTGLYWWQAHVRGQNKDGIVIKDYEVSIKRRGRE